MRRIQQATSLVALLLFTSACRLPDTLSVEVFTESGDSAFEHRDTGFMTNSSGILLGGSWDFGRKYESYDAIVRMARRQEIAEAAKAALGGKPAGGATTAPVTVVVKGDEATEAWYSKLRFPTANEFVSLIGLVLLVIFLAYGIRRSGLLDKLMAIKRGGRLY